MNTTALIETGWAAIVPDPNYYWPDMPPGPVMEWLVELAELAHRHFHLIPEFRTKRSAEEMDLWLARMASIPASSLRPRPLFLLCADLRAWNMGLNVPSKQSTRIGGDADLGLEEWVRAYVDAAGAKAFGAMVDTLLELQQEVAS